MAPKCTEVGRSEPKWYEAGWKWAELAPAQKWAEACQFGPFQAQFGLTEASPGGRGERSGPKWAIGR